MFWFLLQITDVWHRGVLQEDSLVTDMADDVDFSNERYCPFELPEEEYGDMMFERRLATEASESPVASGRVESRGGSTAAETDGIVPFQPYVL